MSDLSGYLLGLISDNAEEYIDKEYTLEDASNWTIDGPHIVDTDKHVIFKFDTQKEAHKFLYFIFKWLKLFQTKEVPMSTKFIIPVTLTKSTSFFNNHV